MIKIQNDSRRKFLKSLAALGTTSIVGGASKPLSASDIPARSIGARYMGDFAAPKLKTVRCAFIGAGGRGSGHIAQFSNLENTEVVAICDLIENRADKAATGCLNSARGKYHQNLNVYHENDDSWKKMLLEVRPDLVVIATPWESHASMAIESMKQGAHAFVEVPLAVTNQELWEIVDTSETTSKHCMMMENVNYGRAELLYLNMCRQGVIGELLHGEAAYIHELRNRMSESKGIWRNQHYATRNGNLYPTHGLGPVAQYMNIARSEDTFQRLVSFSSQAIGRKTYAKKNFPKNHKWNKTDFQGGDINTSIIQTKLGRTIMIQWDETSPRPYTRLNLIQGTKGTLAGYPTRIALEGGLEGVAKDHHDWIQGDQLEAIYQKYEHPLYKRLGELAKRKGGHGGMDFIMRYRIIECLRLGIPLDQNLYEGCLWSAVAPLSEMSVKQRGTPQEFPDFTRGHWKDTSPLEIVT